MKKTIFLLLAIPGIALIAGCAQKQNSQNSNKQENQPEQTSERAASSIMEAVNSEKKMVCTYDTKLEDESFASKSYIDGKKFKIESEIDGKKDYTLFDGDTVYSWTESDKEGTKMSDSCMKDLKSLSGDTGEFTEEESLASPEETFKDASNIKCEETPEIDLSVPSDVTFEDECQIMKDELNASKKVESQTPASSATQKL